jgi:membrane-associated phospholipid phosphatase
MLIMVESEKVLSKRALEIIGVICTILLLFGSILIILEYNEALYIENSVAQFIFEIITFTGNGVFLILVIAVTTFIYDKRFAKNFFLMWIISGSLNSMLKEIFQEPRPKTNITKASERGYSSSGYGFPSGHAQVAASNWGFSSYHFKDKIKSQLIPIFFSIFIFLVALSRAIIGVHSVKQIVWGLLIGIIILITFLYLNPIFAEKFNTLSLPIKITLAVLVSILIAVLGTLLFPEFAGYGINIYATSGGSLLGLSVGFIFEGEYVNYEPSELTIRQKITNLTIGIGLLLIYFIFFYNLMFGTDILIFIQHAVLSFMIIFVIPFIFTKINKNDK